MPRKYICSYSTEELYKAYIEEGRTLKEMCDYLGIKSKITAAKVLTEHGISTDNNARLRALSMQGMTDEEFKNYLETNYSAGCSMGEIAKKLGITPSGVRKYFIRYGIARVSKTSYFKEDPTKNPNWRGGRHKHEGYIEIYCPDHPNANKRKCVYEHQLVMEQHIGRYIMPGEVVHHIDGNKSNNDISNLLLLTNSEHIKLHNSLKRTAAQALLPNGR